MATSYVITLVLPQYILIYSIRIHLDFIAFMIILRLHLASRSLWTRHPQESGYIAFMSRFLIGIPIQPIVLWWGKMVEIKCPFVSRFLGAEFLKGEVCIF